ncbi:MAG: response regulator [Candidatus Promineifilaceae bacterium]
MIKVILVDDHEMVRAGIRRFLEKANDIHVIAEAGDAAAARQLAQQLQPDVAIIDIKLPDQSGIELARQLRAADADIKMLMITAYDDEPYVRAALRAGANGYMLKSAAPSDVISGVRRVARGGSVIDPSLTSLLFGIMANNYEPEEAIYLTNRENEVLRLVANGRTNKEIGGELTISDRTVQSHLVKIFRKLDVNTRTKAVTVAMAHGLISAEK